MLPFRATNRRLTTFAFSMSAYPVDTDTDSPLVECPACQEPLDFHQPDETQPGNLLGVCLACQRWYLWIQDGLELEQPLLVELPEWEQIRRKLLEFESECA